MTDKNETVIALLGQPNSGKSTLFNALTGLKQHVGNWSGKTVEKKEGTLEHNGKKYLVADLPGTYSLSANSDEEIITRDYIAGGKADVVCVLADSSQLQRSLYMLADYAGIKVPTFLILNMSDVAAEQGKSVMPFLVSFGCTMGGAAGARVIDNWGQKVLTIALAWAVPCGAAWAVVPMLSTVWFGGAAPLIQWERF